MTTKRQRAGRKETHDVGKNDAPAFASRRPSPEEIVEEAIVGLRNDIQEALKLTLRA